MCKIKKPHVATYLKQCANIICKSNFQQKPTDVNAVFTTVPRDTIAYLTLSKLMLFHKKTMTHSHKLTLPILFPDFLSNSFHT